MAPRQVGRSTPAGGVGRERRNSSLCRRCTTEPRAVPCTHFGRLWTDGCCATGRAYGVAVVVVGGQVSNTQEFLRRTTVVLSSFDVVARALTLRLLGACSALCSDWLEVHHQVRVRLI